MLDLTSLTTFDALRLRPNLLKRIILAIEEDTPSTTLYFWTGPDRYFDSKMFYGLIKDVGSMSQKIDIYRKTFTTSKMSFKMLNAPMKHTGTVEVNLAYHLSTAKYINRTAKVYIWFEGITQLSDCLQIFEGVVMPLKDITDTELTVELEDIIFRDHLDIPQTLISKSTYPNCPESNLGRPIPTIFGQFALNDEVRGAIAPGIWISDKKAIFADSAIDSIDAVWIYDPDIDELVKLDSGDYTANVNDSGLATVEISDMTNVTLDAYIYPISIGTYSGGTHISISDGVKTDMIDRDADTFMEVSIGSYTPNGESPAYEYRDWRMYFKTMDWSSDASLNNIYMEAKYDSRFNTSRQLYHLLYYGTISGDFLRMDPNEDYTASYKSDDITSAFTGAGKGLSDISHGSTKYLTFSACGYYNSGDGSDYKITEFYELRCHVNYSRPIATNFKIFIECGGREYGSWARSPHSNGDLIEHPVGIIENILRDEVGIGGSDIDTTEFDAVESGLSGRKMAFSLVGQKSNVDLIEDICKLSQLNYAISAQGLHRLTLLKSSGYSSDDTLYKNDIIRDSFKVDYLDLDQMINSLKMLYELNVATNNYTRQLTEADSTGQTEYNATYLKTINADKISDPTTAAALADHFCDSSTGFWSLANISHPKPGRAIVSFACLSFEYIHWEVGDIILMDSGIDDICRNGATSWSNHQMMIIEKQIDKGQILKFKMIHVATTGGA